MVLVTGKVAMIYDDDDLIAFEIIHVKKPKKEKRIQGKSRKV